MKAWAIEKYGRHSQLKCLDLPEPRLADDEVLIQVKAASINPIDFKIRNGNLRFVQSYTFPLILGHDGAGIVTKIGRNVKRFAVGDEVYMRIQKNKTGALAEYVAIKESALSKKPKNLSFEEAASLPLVGLTSWQALITMGQIKPGTRVFIPAGSGGVGTFAIQLAKHSGAYVITNTSTKNLDFVRSLGADEVIDYKKEDFANKTSNIELFFDTLGGDTQKKGFSVLKPGGHMISIVGPPTPDLLKEMGLGPFVQLAASLLSFPTRKRAKRHRARYTFLYMQPNGEQLTKIAELVEAGRIKPVIDRVYSFSEAPQAMAHVESGRARGKVVVKGP